MSSSSPDLSKDDLRVAALKRRNALSLDQQTRAAEALAARAFPVAIRRGTVVAGYWPVRNEINPMPLMRRLGAEGAESALPSIMGNDLPLVFRLWTEDTELVRGPFGIMEPSPNSDDTAPAIVLVPLAAFDRSGHRIGYGAGHYDRTLSQLRATNPVVAIGLAYAFQEITAIPHLPHDVRLDYVLTETATFDFRSC